MDSTAVCFKLCKAVLGECAGPGEYREKGEGTRVSYATTCDSAAFIHTLPHTHPQSPPRRVEQDTQTNRDGSERTNGLGVQFSLVLRVYRVANRRPVRCVHLSTPRLPTQQLQQLQQQQQQRLPTLRPHFYLQQHQQRVGVSEFTN